MNSSVTYYRVNANNQAIASSNDGLGQTSPTEEITPPVLGGTYASGGGTTTIVGQTPGSTFDTSFNVGQYLYYINNAGNYVLMGQIQSIADDHNLTLTSVITYTNPTAGDSLVGSYYLITINEEIYVRVATDLSSNPNSAVIIPDFSSWRNGTDPLTAPNNPTVIAIDRISNVGTPLSTASATNIPFTFQTQNVFTSGTGTQSNTVWPNGDFPAFIWLKLQFAAGQALSPKTLYRFTTQETFGGYTAGAGTLKSDLILRGYSNV
jgi:hypothetical protein